MDVYIKNQHGKWFIYINQVTLMKKLTMFTCQSNDDYIDIGVEKTVQITIVVCLWKERYTKYTV